MRKFSRILFPVLVGLLGGCRTPPKVVTVTVSASTITPVVAQGTVVVVVQN